MSPRPPQPEWEKPDSPTKLDLTLRVITPMFGGGYCPRELDEDNLIRASSIRGHLRFWWRATTGASFTSPKLLFEKESALWGSGSAHGHVSLLVNSISHSEPERCAKYEYGAIPNYFGKPGYALQPFQGKAIRGIVTEEPSFCISKAEFELHVHIQGNDIKDAETRRKQIEEWTMQIKQALCAWVNYGGVGARTRRGCGSLETDDVLSELSLESLPAETHDLTFLKGSILLKGKNKPTALAAWNDAVDAYQAFRQGEQFARDPGSDPTKPKKLGRTRWPEPNTIRNKIDPLRRWTHSVPQGYVSGFPRADLGLPIIFHFIDGGDPPETVLEGSVKDRKRFSSPIITKAIKNSGGGYLPIILILNAPHVWQSGSLLLKYQDGGGFISHMNKNDIELTGGGGVRPLSGKSNAREALIAFVSTKPGWTGEVI